MIQALELLYDVTFYTSILLPILYFVKYRKYGTPYRAFTFYLLMVAFVQVGMILWVDYINPTNNLIFFGFYNVFQFVILSIFYKALLSFRWIYWIVPFVLLFIAWQYYDDPEIIYKYNPIATVITQSILIVYSLVYFYRQLTNKAYFLIINIGLFFYLLSSTLIFSSGNLVFNIDIPTETLKLLTRTNLVLYFVFQILILTEWFLNYSDLKKEK